MKPELDYQKAPLCVLQVLFITLSIIATALMSLTVFLSLVGK